MKINDYILIIKRMGACEEAVKDAHKYETSEQLWQQCERGDWMLWLIGRLCGPPESQSKKKLVLTACKCARLSLKFVPADEKRPLTAIETAESWAQGDSYITLEDVRKAADAAAYAADYAAAAAAFTAADDAAYAADAAAFAADAADAAADAARKEFLITCADIVRDDYPNVDELLDNDSSE